MAKNNPNNDEMHPIHRTLLEAVPPPKVEEENLGGGNSVSYTGFAPLGTADDDEAWKILRATITVAGNITTTLIEFPQSSMEYKFKWSDRATLKYSR